MRSVILLDKYVDDDEKAKVWVMKWKDECIEALETMNSTRQVKRVDDIILQCSLLASCCSDEYSENVEVENLVEI